MCADVVFSGNAQPMANHVKNKMEFFREISSRRNAEEFFANFFIGISSFPKRSAREIFSHWSFVEPMRMNDIDD